MKKNLLLVVGLLALATVNAQQVSDVVLTGANSSHSSFYSLQNGEVSNVTNEDWDIAFSTSLMGADIRINDGMLVELYTYPHGDTSDFMIVDTTGIAGWTQNYNSTEEWEDGAFNAGASGAAFDYGWGTYNLNTHNVEADSIYVIKTLAGDYKKIWIESLAGGSYNFKYANIDNSGMTNESILLSTYTSKNYFYYSLDNGVVIDREPASADWDFVATKYLTFQFQSYFPSTGILMNKGMKVREARGVDVTTAAWGSFAEEETLDVIGFDWKAYNQQDHSFSIVPNLSYFITDNSGNIWQLIFTDYASSTGEIEFTKEMISAVSIDENNAINLGLYPNPTSGQVTFLYDNLNEDVANVSIYDLQGKVVYSNSFNGEGFNQQTVDVSFLNAGIYNVIIQSKNRTGVQKLVIQ